MSTWSVVFDGAGGEEVMSWQRRPRPDPQGQEVSVEVSFAGLNPADLVQRAGRYPAPAGSPSDVPGLEVAGVVTACGPTVQRWKPGDTVMGIVGGGGLSQFVIAHEGCLAPVPEHWPQPQAAATPEAFVTAHDALTRAGRFRPGDRVLVNGANGGVGSAAVQLVGAFGGTAVGTARSTEGLEFIDQLGADPMSSAEYVDGDNPHGPFDLIIELVGGSNLPRDVDSVAKGGRIVVVGVPAGAEVTMSARSLMANRAAIEGTTLRHRPLPDKIAAVRSFEHEVLPLLTRGAIKPYVEATYPRDQLVEAFRHLASSGKQGKVLLDLTT